jgi:AP2 domain-containing protein/HNH endonuclease
VPLHRLIMNAPADKEVDHINGDTLDNRRCNLRICSHKENLRNQKLPKNSKSGYKGVTWYKRIKKWRSHIRLNKKQIHLGYFDDIKLAANAYNEAAIKYFGEFAKLNDLGVKNNA